MDTLIVGIWTINMILSVVYIIYAINKNKNKWIGLLFISLPVFGFFMWFFPKIVLHYNEEFEYDRESLVKRFEFEPYEDMPSIKRELNIVSIEDSMAISSAKEKRALLLEQLKKGIDRNYKLVLPASGDKDSESAHYVAAAKMEVYSKKRKKLKESKDELDEKRGDLDLIHNYLKVLCDYINSELLVPKEALFYKIEYVNLFEELLELDLNKITVSNNAAYITYLIDLEENQKAENYWERCPKALKNESGYRKILEMYYNMRDKNNFYRHLNILENSDIILSAEGLKIVRYWISRRDKDAII